MIDLFFFGVGLIMYCVKDMSHNHDLSVREALTLLNFPKTTERGHRDIPTLATVRAELMEG